MTETYIPSKMLSTPVTIWSCIANPYKAAFYYFNVAVNPEYPPSSRIEEVALSSLTIEDRISPCLKACHFFKHVAVGTFLIIPFLNFFLYVGLCIAEYVESLPEPEPLTEERKRLIQNIEQLKEENEKWKIAFQNLTSFIEKDPILSTTFNSCYEETKHILLPLYEEDDSPPVSDPLAEDWRKKAQRQLYYEELLVSFKDFLNKNPRFAEVVKERLERQGQAAILGILT